MITIPATNAARCRKCQPVVIRFEEGWDVYRRADCYQTETGAWVPRWYDNPIVEDAATRKAALAELATWHVLGVCLASQIW